MTYDIPVAVPDAGDPPAEFNTARAAILDLDTRVTTLEEGGGGLPPVPLGRQYLIPPLNPFANSITVFQDGWVKPTTT